MFFFLMIRRPPISTLFPFTTLFRSAAVGIHNLDAFRSRRAVPIQGVKRKPMGSAIGKIHIESEGRTVVPGGSDPSRATPRLQRSEERRVGKEGRSRWSPDH